jgi:ATP-binding cassette subfamily F protein 2
LHSAGVVVVVGLTSPFFAETMGRKEDLARKAKAKAKAGEKNKDLLDKIEKERMLKDNNVTRAAVLDTAVITGVIASQKGSLDVKIDQFSLSVYGKEFIKDTKIELTFGRRIGLIGQNGSGKSTMLAALAAREVAIPDSIDIWFLDSEAKPLEVSAIQAVVDVVASEHKRLEELSLKLLEEDPEKNAEMLGVIQDKLDKMEPDTFEPRACELLHGLGFTRAMMNKFTKDMSGGWRMRVALAQALFVEPMLLLLDEPTNHLDLGACVWLEEYLSKYPNTLLFTSHSEDFMNGVCTHIMQLTQKGTLVTWSGNYAAYVKTRAEIEKNQLTAYKKEQDDIQHLEAFIRSCGTYKDMLIQAASKQKIIDKMKDKGLTEKPEVDPIYPFAFPDSEKISPPVLAFSNCSFSYSGKKEDHLYENLELGVDLDSRIALVGPNGAGKSTLLKLMLQQIEPTVGEVKRSGKLRIGHYNQHSEEVLDLEHTPLGFLEQLYPNGIVGKEGLKKMETSMWRGKLGMFGITGDFQTRKMKTMSDGMKTRVVMLLISLVNPHVLLLDEPTNHLDMQCIDALAMAINNFSGGLVLVSHDFRLIGQVAKEIWVCDKKTIAPWSGDIQSYKKHLKKQVMKKLKDIEKK